MTCRVMESFQTNPGGDSITRYSGDSPGRKASQKRKNNQLLLNSESTNSVLLNTCKSSTFSPTPIYFTGILNSSEMPMTTPPLAVPSSLVMARQVTSVALVNS